ncbi:McrC family protein [Sediminitomix flava]|uniref:5-methylcytosine-specific restriction enzyme subunit McrC n=1 Tax=Sediminitomix flava TaxID=379075 RepID=A0A315ZY25_SEDFL|nr:restriction endonuclease [Sediminitomix flava]PWJ42247.1 5-methylcytosine-specific restriction enzyme subunit McrC [Sediminitomix flava]
MKKQTTFTVFEHQSLRIGEKVGNVKFDEKHHEALVRFHGDDSPYFTLIHRGVKFCEYVGVIRVDNILIEVLPKADRNTEDSAKEEWRKALVGMLKVVGAFNISAPSSSTLSLKSNYILDLYFELFLKEIEYLLHFGLVKQYRREESNQKALKGKLQLSEHIRKNVVHKECFYVSHTVYDHDHKIHQILLKALKLVADINQNPTLNVKSVLFKFPELADLKVTEKTFNKLHLSRKFKNYENALNIAYLLLLNYHPDLTKGKNDVLALMFNMNDLWERFVLVSLKRNLKDFKVKGQISKLFWKGEQRGQSYIRPDIVLSRDESTIVLDTKWKYIKSNIPSPEDLRQLYAYHKYYDAEKVALVYPGVEKLNKGIYQDGKEGECAVIQIKPSSNISEFMDSIENHITNWIQNNS